MKTRQRTRWNDLVALVAATVAAWSAIVQQSVTIWTLAVVVAALILYEYPRFRRAAGEPIPRENILTAPSDRSDTRIAMVLAGVALLIVVGFFSFIYIGLAGCIPFGLGGEASC